MRKFLAVAILVTLSACASLIAETPAQRVFAAKQDYRALLTLAVDYVELPRCDETERTLCSDADAVARIQKIDRYVEVALDEAEGIVRTPGLTGDALSLAIRSAESAIAVFRVVLTEEGLL